ncbi:hypothetical protein LA76x_0393 [Lysobacter antibioticus]|uniref:Uncharacterized protein n=1 Tax=Lysobacter antibioticus TaxID=84531 RepID=A0A0S2F4S8_LYSAN|nr:hypothetical protein LA76x_0393 [Lysobacter antibioticus]
MLYRYLNWFESEPADALLPYDGDAMSDFVTLGALAKTRRTRRIHCARGGHQFALQLHSYQERDVKCVVCAAEVEMTSEYMSTQVQLDWLPALLARRLAGPNAAPDMLIENRLWRLASLNTAAGDVPVYLLRAGWYIDFAPILSCLQLDSVGRQIVLTSSPLINTQLADTHRTILALDEVARMETEGLWLDFRRLGDAITAPYPVWFDHDPASGRLAIGDEAIVLRRSQKEVVGLLAAAHEAGHQSVKWKPLLRQARYGGQYTSLWQALPSELRRFIDTAKGDVWIRKEALPPSRAGPPSTSNAPSPDDHE